MKRTLLFLHVQKTGGSTLAGALENRFAARDCLQLYLGQEPDLTDVDRFRFVTGHLDASFIDRFRERPFVATLLRDPVDRALSAYSYSRSFPRDNRPDPPRLGRGPEARALARAYWRLTHECSIGELIDREAEVAREYLGNRQARALCGSSPGEERLDDAIEALESCNFVGLCERLDESAQWLTRRFGWNELGALPQSNVTSGRVRREQVPAAAMKALLELTSVDRQLHEHGMRLFERRLAEWGAAHDPRDPEAEIPDAPLVPDLPFDEAIHGGGWMGREEIGNGTSFCWIGDTNRAWVDLAEDQGANSLIVEMPHVIDQGILESLRISVDGRQRPHELREADGGVVATAALDRGDGLRTDGTSRVVLAVERSMSPLDVDPASTDNRQLSVAVSRVALVRS